MYSFISSLFSWNSLPLSSSLVGSDRSPPPPKDRPKDLPKLQKKKKSNKNKTTKPGSAAGAPWLVPMPHLENAGKFDSINEKTQDLLDIDNQTFTGCQINLSNSLHPNFTTIHSLTLGKRENVNPFTGQVLDDERSQYAFTSFLKVGSVIMQSRWATGDGPTNNVLAYERGPISAVLHAHLSEGENRYNLEASYSKNIHTVQVKVGEGVGVSYTQPLTQNLSVGAELMLLGGPDDSFRARTKYLLKHHNPTDQRTLNLSVSNANNFRVGYSKTVIKDLDVTTALDLNHHDTKWVTTWRLGYNYRPNQGTSLRGVIDSTQKVTCVVEEPMSEMLQVHFSAKIDYPNNVYDFGFGTTMHM